MTIYILTNPTAGSGKATEITAKICRYLADKAILYNLVESRHPNHLIELAKEVGQIVESDLVNHRLLCIGGDGSIHQVVEGLKLNNIAIPIGVIPAGTGNDFCLANGIPDSPIKALELFLNGTVKQRDLIKVTNLTQGTVHYAVNNFGIGVDGRVIHYTSMPNTKKILKKLRLGRFSYLSKLLTALSEQKAYQIRWCLDGVHGEQDNVILSTTMNHPYIGGHIKLDPPADPTSGTLDLVIIHSLTTKKIMNLLPRLLKDGSHIKSTSEVTRLEFQSGQLEVISDNQFAHLDGEALKETIQSFQIDCDQQTFYL